MKVLLLTEVFPPRLGGSGRWLWELYRRLDAVDVVVVAGDAQGSEMFDCASRLPTFRLPMTFASWGLLTPRGIARYARASARFLRVVSKACPDEIHCGKSLPEGLIARLAAWRHRLPYSCYAHGEELTLARTSRELRRLNAWVLSGARTVFANSHNTRRLLLDEWRLPPDRVVVMHPGVDTSRFLPAPPEPAVRAAFGWTGRHVVLTVGALQARKGQDAMIRALPLIRRDCPSVLYVIAGEGWQKPYLEELVTTHRVTDFVQFRDAPSDDEVLALYQQCDLFVLPNRQVGWDFEGFGIVLLEAQACGRAVIAGRSGGAPEAIDAGRTGELVDGESVDELARVVVSLLTDDARREALGRAGREWATTHFDWRVAAARAKALFARYAGSRPPAKPNESLE